MLDVIVRPDTPKAFIVFMQLALLNIKANIISANSLKEGFEKGSSEFVCFMGNGAIYPTHFADCVKFLNSHVKFKKLSMIAVPVTDPVFDKRIYSYKLDETGVNPIFKQASSELYPIEIGHIAGAIIRRSALEPIIKNFTGNAIFDSYAICLHFWMSGKMVYLNPKALYIADNMNLARVIEFKDDPWKNNEQMVKVREIWKREFI